MLTRRSWFAVTMGTGVVSCLLFQIPYQHSWLYHLSIIVFILNVLVWSSFLSITILRLILYPETLSFHLRDDTQLFYMATCPTGLSTLINMVVYVCVPAWGGRTIQFVSLTAWLSCGAAVPWNKAD